VANVVADLVRAKLRELHADADTRGPSVAREHARHEPSDREVDGLEQRLGQRARTLPCRRRLERH
jgi:hypothetical protein